MPRGRPRKRPPSPSPPPPPPPPPPPAPAPAPRSRRRLRRALLGYAATGGLLAGAALAAGYVSSRRHDRPQVWARGAAHAAGYGDKTVPPSLAKLVGTRLPITRHRRRGPPRLGPADQARLTDRMRRGGLGSPWSEGQEGLGGGGRQLWRNGHAPVNHVRA